jgi:integrase
MGARTVGGMSIQKLPSGGYRAQVYHEGRNVSVSKVLGGPGTFRTKTEAKQARAAARERLRQTGGVAQTLGDFYSRWTSDPLFARPKESTNILNHERTKSFVDRFGNLPINRIGDREVAEWLQGGKRNGTVPALRAMFNDAASAKGGRLVESNPFSRLGLPRGRGRRDQQPPTEEMVWTLISCARKHGSPAFAAWLQVGAFTGLRSGELDALRWSNVDFDASRIAVREQFNRKTRTFTLPKNGQAREAPLTALARAALVSLPRESEFCFVSLRGSHLTPSSRSYPWKAARAAAGWKGNVHMATRHFAGWYMTNVLEMPSEDVAIALGHTDGGDLVRKLYGHRETNRALDRVVAAYERRAPAPKAARRGRTRKRT